MTNRTRRYYDAMHLKPDRKQMKDAYFKNGMKEEGEKWKRRKNILKMRG